MLVCLKSMASLTLIKNISYDKELRKQDGLHHEAGAGRGGAALSISGEFDYDSYQETDYVCGYGKGTGYWVNTNLFFTVSLADVYDENCDLLESDFDAERLKNELSDALDII